MLGTLLGNYRVMEQLGQGGMGMAYVGRHEAVGRRVVVKVLQPEVSSNVDMVQRFFNEAQATTAIGNPGIAQVFDFGTTPDGLAYIVMEHLEGETLAARLKQRHLDHDDCCRLGRQIANVLQAAHASGITHRDLKPDKLFLVPDLEVSGGERVKVLDFGIAKLAGEARASSVETHTGLAMATPHYMSPEQCRGTSAVDARADIYSLGCILFEMACHRPPFIGPGAAEVVAAHLHDPPPQPQHLAPDMPPRLAALIAQMLAKLPDARPQTMTAVSHALDEILGTLGASARGSSPLPVIALAPSAMPSPAPSSEPKIAPAPPPVVPSSPQSTALPASAEMAPVQPRTAARRGRLVLGGTIIAVAAAAITLVLVPGHSSAPSELTFHDELAATPPVDVAIANATAVSPPASVITVAKPMETPKTAVELDTECRRYETEGKWDALARCGDQLKSLDPQRAAELGTRAAEEARSAPHITAFQEALSDPNLKQAKAELDQIWPGSVDYPTLKRFYDAAEAQEIDALATELDSIKDTRCEAYHQLLAKEQATNPPRVMAEATRRVSCTPPSGATPTR